MIQKSWKTFWSRESEKSRLTKFSTKNIKSFHLNYGSSLWYIMKSYSQERYERYCVNKPKSECVVKVVIYFLFKFFLGSMACTYKEQLSCSTHCLSATTYLMAGKLKMLARFIAPFFRYFFFKTSSVLLLLFSNIWTLALSWINIKLLIMFLSGIWLVLPQTAAPPWHGHEPGRPVDQACTSPHQESLSSSSLTQIRSLPSLLLLNFAPS